MTAAPLWLIQNVRLADRDGLWQIAIDKGRFGEITPMGEARDESYEVLNARGGLAIPPFIEPHIHLDTTRRPASQTGTSPALCLRGLSAGRSGKRCSAMKTLKPGRGKPSSGRSPMACSLSVPMSMSPIRR